MTTDWFTASPTPFGPGAGCSPRYEATTAGDESEQRRLDLADPEVGGLRERGEAGQVGAGRAALHHHVEEVAAEHADDRDHAVEQHGDEHRRPHAGHDQPVDRRDAQHGHGVDLVADRAGTQVGADRRARRRPRSSTR